MMKHEQDRKHGVSRMAGVVLAGLMSVAANGASGAEKGAAAESPKNEEMKMKNQWVQEHLTDAKAKWPFSFVYDGKASEGLLTEWSKKVESVTVDANRTQRTLAWTDPKTGLEVRCVAVDYADYPAVEWTVWFKNIGTTNTPILENIQGLDARFMRDAKADEFVLHGIKGDFCTVDSFEPYQRVLAANTVAKFAPPDFSGKSSDGPDGWPYYNLQRPGGGVILAIGWPGQWASSFTRDGATGLRIRAGQQLTRLYLKPGEEIRTPLIAMLFWQGTDVVEAQNLWRRWYVAHNMPRADGRLPEPVIAVSPSACGEQTAANCRSITEVINAPGSHYTALWVDAGWYPCDRGPHKGGSKWLNTGTWTPDPVRLPNGFREFSDLLHANGKQFILWFEPERVGDPNSWLAKEHPGWLLKGTPTTCGAILDVGNPVARQWLIDHVSGMITKEGIDWYREDMNGGGPAPAWRQHDASDRQGITENLYVQGHLSFWDELRRRHPSLRIDSCASGGRRNDLETMRRAVPLLRSDLSVTPNLPAMVEGNQGHTYGLSAWLPYQGTGCHFNTEPYAYRSFYCSSFVMTRKDQGAMQKAYAECRKIAPLMLADYYPLTPYSLKSDRWIAWQFNRPEQGDGVVQAFRRKDCGEAAQSFRLRGLDPAATYEVTNFDVAGSTKVSGKDLMEKGLTVEIKDKPGAAVIVYQCGW